MSQTVADLLNAALALSEDERAELVDLLTDTLEAPGALHPAWKAVIHRRAAEIDSGKVKPIPWEEVDRRAQAVLDGDDGAAGGG